MERQAIATVQRYAIYAASGLYEMNGDEPSVEDILAAFDEGLVAEPAMSEAGDLDLELLQLMGVR